MNKTGSNTLMKLKDGQAVISVIGLGYVGLPLAVAFAEAGFSVIGLDVNEDRVGAIMEGKSYILDISDDVLRKVVDSQSLKATADPLSLAEADVIIICVPTPLRKTRDPDISFIIESLEKIKSILRQGQLIILESTTYPGTTREVLLPELESKSLKAGRDFYLAFSPERIDPGNRNYNLKNTPKVVGGLTEDCTSLAAALYRRVADKVVTVSSTDAAEMVKLLENTFRAVNIAMVNEVAIMCHHLGLDTWEVIDAASSKPFGFMPFKPGPGLGGHCIPIDPHYLSWKLKSLNYTARFIELAGEINSHMPDYVLGLITAGLNDRGKAIRGSKILIIGVAYKKDVSDVRESPALDIIDLLRERGAEITYYDPYVSEIKLDNFQMASLPELDEEFINQSDCVVIITDHSGLDWRRIYEEAEMIVDTRNALYYSGIRDECKIIKL